MIDSLKKRLIKYSSPPKVDSSELDEFTINNSRGTLLFVLLLMSLLLMIVFGIISLQNMTYNIAINNVLGAVLYAGLIIYLKKSFKIDLISYLYASILGSQFLYLIVSGGISNFGYVWTLLYPLGILFFFGSKKGLLISLFFLASATLFLFTISVYKKFGIEFQLRYIGIYSAITIIAYTYDLIREKLNKTIVDKNEDLRNKLSDLEKKDKELTSAKNKAEHADKLKSEFLAQMSHEIRTPINTILNYSWLIEEELGNRISKEVDSSFKSINEASKRLIRTIDMILSVSVVQADTYNPKYEKIKLSTDVIHGLINEFEQSAKLKKLYLKVCDTFENEVQIVADKYTITQAIANLIDNAIKYTENGGVLLKLYYEEDKCKIYIIDTGIGISDEYLPRLFDKFTQETEGYSRKYEGSGLGLTLVKKYCEINNAEISVKSSKGNGTTFTIDLHLNGKY